MVAEVLEHMTNFEYRLGTDKGRIAEGAAAS